MTAKRRTPSPDRGRVANQLTTAVEHATSLGHKTCLVGRRVDCWHCDRDGVVGPDGARIGSVFEERCK